ncbi:MAG TPA: methylmalonyl-CoA epimerase [Solirubrobacteraceae bacterium]|jgi:methylmalonyl-CoA epimerase|nr:methylmalonyl-CoA epimerase [Solirubrobacteraceae bacterium]
MFEQIDHVGIAVTELEPAIAAYGERFGMGLVHREVLSEHGIEAALLSAGASRIELLAPYGEESAIGRFLENRGPGMHHVAYTVADIDAALDELRSRDVELIDAAPRPGMLSSRIAFVAPKEAAGVLTELVEVAR